MTTQAEFSEVIERIGGGNIGAFRVLDQMQKSMPLAAFGFLIGALETHKIFGPKLWIAYKDYARGNVDTMSSAILNQSPELLTAIQIAYPDWDWADE